MLPKFFKNYDENGRWKPNGLEKDRQKSIEEAKQKLALIDLESIGCSEAKEFIKKLDLIIDMQNNTPTIQDYIITLQQSHAEGKELL